MSQEAVVDLHPEELQLSGEEEEEEEEGESQGMDNGRADHDLGLKIRRTVTQVGGVGPQVLRDSPVPHVLLLSQATPPLQDVRCVRCVSLRGLWVLNA